MAESTFTFRIDEELKAAFTEVAANQERTAAQLLRVLMNDAIYRDRERREHDRWFRGEIEWIAERDLWAAIDTGDRSFNASRSRAPSTGPRLTSCGDLAQVVSLRRTGVNDRQVSGTLS